MKTINIRPKLDYQEFGSLVNSYIVAGLKISNDISDIRLRIKNAYWKNESIEAPIRQFIDIVYKNRELTIDLATSYSLYLKTSLENAIDDILNNISIILKSYDLEQIFKSSVHELNIPRDASVLPMCLDNGESLKAYHKKIGYQLPEGWYYGNTALIKEQDTKQKDNYIFDYSSTDIEEDNEDCFNYEEDKSC